VNSPGLSRRSILKTASLASAAGSLPSLLRGQPSPPAGAKLNVALIGFGV